jgi:DNA-binding CsgD family transcriptional regulator
VYYEDMVNGKGIWGKLLQALGRQRTVSQHIAYDRSLWEHVRTLAEMEQRSEEEVLNDLLAAALVQRRQEEEILQRWRVLSPREQEVAALIRQDCTDQQIAERLSISANTVKTHVRNIRRKLGAGSKAAVRYMLIGLDFRE